MYLGRSMHDRDVSRTGRAESSLKKSVPDIFFRTALHVAVLKEGQVGRHGTENPGTVLRQYVLCRLPRGRD